MRWLDSVWFGQRWGNSWTGSYDRGVYLNTNTATVYRPDGKAFVYTYNYTAAKWKSDADITSTLVQLPNSTGWRYVNTDNDDTELYDNAGKLLSITSRAGYSQQLIYTDGTNGTAAGSHGGYVLDANGNATTTALPVGLLLNVVDSFGRTLSFGYNNFNYVVKMTTPNGGVYRYSYDTATTANGGNLLSVTYPDNTTRSYVYNETVNTSGASLPNALTGIVDENSNRFGTYKYDTTGRAISSEHAGGVEKSTLSYNTDANGNITSTVVTDSLNTARIYSFTTILGVTKSTGVSQPCSSGCGAASATTYDANGNVSSKTDFNGNVTNYVYDLTRNLETSRTEAYNTPQARTITTQWHTTYRLPTLITEPGKTTSFTYDTSGNLLSKTITDTVLNKSRTWTYTYNSLGQVLTANGPRTDVNDVTTYTYYSSASSTAGSVHSIGDLATVTNALGHFTSITNYDLNGRPLSITDANGVVTTLTYTPRGWLKTRTVNNAQTTTYDYDGVGQLTQVTLPDNSALKYTYDTAHRLTDIQDGYVSGGAFVASGNKIHYTLDAMGNRTKEDTQDPSNAILKTRSRVFDALNRLQQDIGGTSPSTQITQYGYDNNGNLKTVTDANSGVTTNGYDALNRLITVTDPASGVSTTNYNALDQVTQVKDPRLVSTNYTVDALGNVTLTQSPDSGSTTNVHDAAGNIIQKTDARGVVSNYSYDALNRLTAIQYPSDPSLSTYFAYDNPFYYYSKGRLTTIEYGNTGSIMALTYDEYGNLKSQNDWVTFSNGGDIQFASSYMYDAANRVQRITYAPTARRTIYTRNALGQITQVQTQDNASAPLQTIVSNISYEPFGPIKALTFGNGVTTTIAHDSDYQVARISTTSTPNWDYVYGYDPVGNIVSQTDQIGSATKTFTYDGLNRITLDSFGGPPYGHQYDTGGNRLSGGFAFLPYSQTYAANSNRLTQLSGANRATDAAGNLLMDSGDGTLTYNAANQLAQWSKSGATTAIYQYNGFGWRNQKQQGTQLTHYGYAPDGKLLAQVKLNADNSYNQIIEYLWLDDLPIAQIKTTYAANNVVSARRLTYIHADHLNTPRVMTDSTKKVVWKWHSDAYGMISPNNNPDGDSVTDTLDLRFAGQLADSESNLFYNMNRYYDPMTGRFTQFDLIGPTRDYSNPILQVAMRAGVPLKKGLQRDLSKGLNQPYAYAENNPVMFTDPFGLECYATMNMGTPGYVCNSGTPYPSSYSHQGENSSGVSEMTPIDNRSAAQSECDACKFTCNVATALGPGPIFPTTLLELGGYGSAYLGNKLICAQMCKKECSKCE
ncbi:MAG: RHS repeat-associated core domain-containing protein [Spongiibacteraceae bacterium]